MLELDNKELIYIVTWYANTRAAYLVQYYIKRMGPSLSMASIHKVGNGVYLE
jgi:hypothetical protein